MAGVDASVRSMPSPVFGVLSRVHPTHRELRETHYQVTEPFVVDHSKFETAFGADPTPHHDAITTLAWYRERRSDGAKVTA